MVYVTYRLPSNYNRVMATRKRTSAPINAEIAGISAAAVRDFLLQASEFPHWTSGYLEQTLAVDQRAARSILDALSIVGYIEPDPENPRRWRNTTAGNTVAKVSRARPVKRQTAEKSLEQFLARIREVNLESQFLYAVARAVVFGPFVTSGSDVKNVDIAIELQPKIADARKLAEKVKADADRAETGGKRFKSFSDKLQWGKTKVKQHLKGRSRTIALYDLTDSMLLQPHRVVFEQ